MKIIISKILVIGSLFYSSIVIAEDQWWSYLSAQENGPSSTRVDLSFNNSAPLQDYVYVVVSGITFSDKNRQGLPSPFQLDSLNTLQEDLLSFLESKLPYKYAGTFTYQHEQLHYIYVQNKETAQKVFKEFYLTACKDCKSYINVKYDPQWSGYTNFLYPSKQIIKYYGLKINP
ncbi:MAG: DUF695 domain-containing protein [Saccharospirillaceae bacterium]|nr:DUF695 domain-containing protein [Pseudomonadales bacterium]NRB77431.1 DUF695 domain-containing protein [Saccharospirillaceae bacterium]